MTDPSRQPSSPLDRRPPKRAKNTGSVTRVTASAAYDDTTRPGGSEAVAGDKTNDLIMRIGTSLISDRRFAGEDWSSIAVVSIVQPGVGQLSGYMFMPDGKSKPATPRNGELHVMFEDLQSVMMVDGKRPWKSALFQVNRDGLKFSVDFEYDDPLRRKVSPENIELVIGAIRPR